MKHPELAPNVLFDPVVECSCPSNCPRHGNCQECRNFHATARRPRPPFCERQPKQSLLKRIFGN